MIIDGVLLTVTLLCLYTDIKHKKIYNAILAPAAVIGFLANAYTMGFSGMAFSLKGLFLGIALLFIPFALGGMGGGDVKLLGVIGALKGPEFVFGVFLAAALIGGVISVIVMLKQGKFGRRFKAVIYTFLSILRIIPPFNFLESKDSQEALMFPYGIALAAGTFVAYLVR
jgi:prepilin peptidase CpaA